MKIPLTQLRGLALSGDFEGVVGFGAAFRAHPVHHAFTLHNPERFVLDVRHADRCA
ncbi:AMIN-like domain-containing (lipo)protein [Streptomyces spiralis]